MKSSFAKEASEMLTRCIAVIVLTDVKLLQAELRKARLYNEVLQEVIKIAEEELGLPIRKKSGTKQS